MDTLMIKLTLNNEQRDVEANIWHYHDSQELIVYGIAVTTTHGGKTHNGTMHLKPKDGNEYTIKDARDIRYHGMRGNGHGRCSRFRHVGFFPTAQVST